MEKLIEFENGAYNLHKPTYICSKTDFTAQTDKEDGCELQVIDESSHTVTGYYIAFNGYWNER